MYLIVLKQIRDLSLEEMQKPSVLWEIMNCGYFDIQETERNKHS